MMHNTLNGILEAILGTLEGYPRISALVFGLAVGRVVQTLAGVLR